MNQKKLSQIKKSFRVARLHEFRRVSGKEWFDRVMKVDEKNRSHVAYVIWWDWFGGKNVSERWHHLDLFLANIDKSEQDLDGMINGLVTCGYTLEEATGRIGTGKQYMKFKK